MSYFSIVKKWNNGRHANTKIVYLLRHSDETSLDMEIRGVTKLTIITSIKIGTTV